MTRLSIVPQYFVYGEPDRPLEIGFVHLERVRDRNAVHKGQVAPHTHGQMAQITFWTRGHGTYLIEDRAQDFHAPAVAFVPSGVVHGFSIARGTDAIVASIANEMLSTLSGESNLATMSPIFVQRTEAIPEWRRLGFVLETMRSEYERGARAGDTVLASLVRTALSYVGRLNNHEPAIESSPRVALALRFRVAVNAHFRQDRTIGEYIATLGTTQHLLWRAVTEVLGMSLNEVILDRRLLEAKRLLHFTVRSVEDISFEIGFSDPAYFSRFFKRRTGLSPASWRAAQLEQITSRAGPKAKE